MPARCERRKEEGDSRDRAAAGDKDSNAILGPSESCAEGSDVGSEESETDEKSVVARRADKGRDGTGRTPSTTRLAKLTGQVKMESDRRGSFSSK